ncbi:MAG: lytic transglycosylase domain-containing protein [Polyangiaceae bacterium]|nr:lytic transglycosylase domain-containing protein [Polyangiaceae bacterium]
MKSQFRRSTAYLAAVVVLTGLLLPANAEIQRRVDADGVITFSNETSSSPAPKAKKGTPQKKSNSPKLKSPSAAPAPRAASPAAPALRSKKNQSSVPGGYPKAVAPYLGAIREAAALYRLPEELIIAIMRNESGFRPGAISPAGACGLMQLMPATAERMMVTDIFDPRQNILAGARYLRILANLFNGDLHLTAAAYNAGEGAVIRYGGIPPYRETQLYVQLVAASFAKYQDR